jgi:hypothetical protein
MLFITPISASQKRTSLARLVIPGQNSCRPLSSLGRLARCSDLKNVEMLRTKAEHGHGGMHGAVRRFVAIALACLLFAGVAAAQAQTKSETESETKSETKSESRSDHLRGGWYPWDPYQYRDYKHGVPVLTGFDVEIERASRALWPSRLICRKSPGRSTWRR